MSDSSELSGPLGRAPLSAAVEDYLKTIYTLKSEGAPSVSTQSLAAKLNVAPPSATAMCKKLTQMGLAQHTPYYGIELSPTGEMVALEVIRHHRIIETYLARVLGMPWDKVHDEAERLEHVLSEDLEARMMEALGHPTRDPHGAPIPGKNGEIAHGEIAHGEIAHGEIAHGEIAHGEIAHGENEVRLCNCEAGTRAKIAQVDDASPQTLRHLQELGLVPGAMMTVTRNERFEGLMRVELQEGEAEIVVGAEPASAVWIERG